MTAVKLPLTVGVLLCAVLVGCGDKPEIQTPKIPLYIEGTIAQFGQYVGFASRKVQGYGVVVGLGKNGSAEVPEKVRNYLIQYLHKQKLGFWREYTAHLHPKRILRDLDTAVVLVVGEIPHGAPKGSRFDLQIKALDGTNTRSLAGGMLLPAELRLAIAGLAAAGGPTHPWGSGYGEVFTNPVADRSKTTGQVRLQEGRIIGGGYLSKDRPVRLMLREPSFRLARQIEERINQRFRDPRSKRPVASAQSDETVEIHVPPQYARDYRHFLDLVLHLPLARSASTNELRTKRLLEGLAQPEARYEQLALSLEAIGGEILPMIQPHYSANEPYVAFFAARTGLRMGDTSAGAIILEAAGTADSPLQVRAIRELGKYPDLPRATGVLRSLIDDGNWLVRLAAYESLVAHKDRIKIKRMNVGGRFKLDVIESKGPATIYATQTGEPRAVVFGGNLPVSNPLFFTLPDDLITMADSKRADGTTKLMMYRKVPRSPRPSGSLYIDFKTTDLIQTLGGLPDRDRQGTVKALSLTYSQVLRVLQGLCNSDTGGIDARFELQPIGESGRIIDDDWTGIRPD